MDKEYKRKIMTNLNEKECELLLLHPDKRLDYYRKYANELQGIDFIFFDSQKASIKTFYPKQTYKHVKIVPLANYGYLWLLSSNTHCNSTLKVRTEIEISFDSNIFSELNNDNALEGDILKLKIDLNNSQVSTDIIPYVIERTLNEHDIDSSYNDRLHSDFINYFKIFGVKDDDYNTNAMPDTAYNKFLELREDSENRLFGKKQYFVSYAYLLKTFSLYKRYTSIDTRIEKFSEFIATQIYRYIELTGELCFDFLTKGCKSKYSEFFKMFHQNKIDYKKLLSNIKGMAWDLTLIYNSIANSVTSYMDRKMLKLVYFCTADRQLANIIVNNPIKSLSIRNGSISQMFFMNGLDSLEINQKYKNRIIKFGNHRESIQTSNMILLEKKLEEEVRIITGPELFIGE